MKQTVDNLGQTEKTYAAAENAIATVLKAIGVRELTPIEEDIDAETGRWAHGAPGGA